MIGWQRTPPEGTERYVWFWRSGSGSDEPTMLYVGLMDGMTGERGVWDGKNSNPVPIASLDGLFLHPALEIPYVPAADRNALR